MFSFFARGAKRVDAALSMFTVAQDELNLALDELKSEQELNEIRIARLNAANYNIEAARNKASKALMGIKTLIGE